MTKKIIKWRLKELPTAAALAEFIKEGIITKDEAREILFSQEEIETRDEKSLKEEIKFLRELVEKMSDNSKTTIIKTIREVERPWKQQPWINPYITWCSTTTPAIYAMGGSMPNAAGNDGSSYKFSDIKSF